MTTRFVISIILLVVSGSSSWATASTARSHTTGLFCQGGSDFGQNDYIDCRLDSYNAQNALFMSRRQSYERLFLGGDAYSAPMVLQKSGNGSWTPYVIGRDYLGSITNITTTSGTSVATYSYNAWGRIRDPQTLTPYSYNSQPSLMLGRGYCGHEHLSNFGLINMNARLYDPVLGRFLSPDPYVQAPDFSQNFNRYAYALNNPLKYTDESGEFIVLDSWLIGLIGGGFPRAWKMAENDIRIWGGLFNADENKEILGKALEIISRLTWQLPQTVLGFIAAQSMNTFHMAGGVESVEYLHGATVLKGNKNGWGGITLGSFIMGDCDILAKDDNALFQHEFGHYLQSQSHGLIWLFDYGIPSLFSTIINNDYDKHNEFYTEQDANARSLRYFAKRYGGDKAIDLWKFDKNKIIGFDKNKDYYSQSNQLALSKAILFNTRIETKQTTNTYFPHIIEDEETIPFIF